MPRARNKTPGPPTAGGYRPGANPGGGTQTAAAAHGLPYGEHKNLVDSQKVVPLPAAPGPPQPAAPPPAGAPGPPAQTPPDGTPPPNPMQAALQAALASSPPQGPGLAAPTERPGEHVMTGPAVMPGAPPAGPLDQILANMNRAYELAPSEGLKQLIAQTEQSRGLVS